MAIDTPSRKPIFVRLWRMFRPWPKQKMKWTYTVPLLLSRNLKKVPMEIIKQHRLNPDSGVLETAVKIAYLVRNSRGDYQVAINTEIKGTYGSLDSAERVFDGVVASYGRPKKYD